MKYSFLLVFLLSVGCASPSPIEKKISEKYIGRTGYFKVAPQFAEYGSPKHKAGEELNEYWPCEKSTITAIRKVKDSLFVQSNGIVFIDFKNSKKEFTAMWIMNNEKDLDQYFDNLFVNKFDIDDRSIATSDGTNKLKDMVCGKKLYIGMEKKYFDFILGPPSRKNTMTNSGGKREQYVYGDPLNGAKYFYFVNDKLSTWQY